MLYILFIFPKPFEGRFHASCPLIFLCIFPKNKKILLHNHSYQFRKSIINKIFLFNLQPTFQFHQLSQLGPLEKFSPLIQDRSASAGPCSLMWGLPLYRINCVPACSTGILLPAVFPQSGLCPTQRAIFSLWVPNYWEPRLTQNPPISWQPFSLCLWSLGTLHNSEVCKLLLFSPFVPRICLLIYFY